MAFDADAVMATTTEWSTDEDVQLCDTVVRSRGDFEAASKALNYARTAEECAARAAVVKRRGQWTRAEDEYLRELVTSSPEHESGTGSPQWVNIASLIPGRTGKQCRERYKNHLAPGICKKAWTAEEDARLVEMQALHGNSWCRIARELPGRAENAVKNRWNGMFNKRVGALVAAQGGGMPLGSAGTGAERKPRQARSASIDDAGRVPRSRRPRPAALDGLGLGAGSSSNSGGGGGAPADGLLDGLLPLGFGGAPTPTSAHSAGPAGRAHGRARGASAGSRRASAQSVGAHSIGSSLDVCELSFEDLSLGQNSLALDDQDSLQLLSLSNLSTDNLQWSADDTAQTVPTQAQMQMQNEHAAHTESLPVLPPMPSPAPHAHTPAHARGWSYAAGARALHGREHEHEQESGLSTPPTSQQQDASDLQFSPQHAQRLQSAAEAGEEDEHSISAAADEARARLRRRIAEERATGAGAGEARSRPSKRKYSRAAPLPLHVPQLPQLDASSLYTGAIGGACGQMAARSEAAGVRAGAGHQRRTASSLQQAGSALTGLMSPPAKRRLGHVLTPLSPCPSPGVGALPSEWMFGM